MKNLPLLLFLLCSSLSFSQDSLQAHPEARTYVTIKTYKERGIPLTKEDTLNFRFHNNDTLVLVNDNYLWHSRDGKVRVEYEPRDSAFLEIYKNVAFGNQLKEIAPTETMKLWKEDVRVLFDSTVPPVHRAELMRFASEVSAGVDSLTIYEVKDRREANFFIFYRGGENEFDYEPRITGKAGGYYVNWNGKQQLYRSVLKINSFEVETLDRQLSILKYFFIKSLGRFHTSNNLPCESYFSDCPVNRELTEMDLEIVKYHYSYGICKGVNLEIFEKLHRDMQQKLEQEPNARLFVVHSN